MKKLAAILLVVVLCVVGALAVSCVDPDEAMPHYKYPLQGK
jgi:hypothetical protein